MNSRERIRAIIAGQEADRCGFWLGNPYPDTWPIYHAWFGTENEEALRRKLGDDYRWIPAGEYRHPAGKGMFDIPNKSAHGTPGPFAECEDPAAVDDLYEWPNPDYLDFEPVLARLRQAGPYYRASGFWAPFYHHVMDLFGMEKYMMNMYLNPELVQAVTDRVCSFFHEANERFFDAAGDLMDGYFFGNDFGTQRDLICGPTQFDRFVMPWFVRFTEQAHARGYQVILHSCGSVAKVIDRLIDAGVECLHPLQALAADMDAESLAQRFKGRISFLGGIDTQQLLVHGSPEEVKADVRRVKKVLGPRLIVSPSHEALLPNVSPQNVQAMAEAALE
ncbi:MAG: uroporphyrinogen decarboxylase family protein [Candidatus Latescibacterota bacterium]